MEAKKLLNLIKKEEGVKLDFKQRLDLSTEGGKKELAKDICAIANSKGGRGYLIIGIEDKTKGLIGISKDDYGEEQIQQIISSRIEPPIPISYEVTVYKNVLLGIITVYDSPQKPYQLRENGAFYIRRGSTTDTMRKQELISAFQDNFLVNSELCPIVKSSVECFDKKLVTKYFVDKGIEINEDNILEVMEEASLIHQDKESNKYMATLGGLLVFSRNNNVYIPQNMIRIVNRVNKSLNYIIYINGCLLDIIDSSEETLKNIIPDKYPIECVLEGVKNAVLYRDYALLDRVIEIVVDYKYISIVSPGALIDRNEINNTNNTRRNMWIYEKLISLDDKGRFVKSGRGFYLMKKKFKNIGRIKFINSIYNNSFKIIYPGLNKFEQ
jgi:predicted HTH transcriptional regulator